jgi:Holliday junction resolvase RusA-like endonuclease
MIPGRVDVEVTLVFPAVRRRDRDNYSQKALNDALKGIVIEDDSSDVIVRQTVEFRVEPGCIPHTIVVVRPAGEDV